MIYNCIMHNSVKLSSSFDEVLLFSLRCRGASFVLFSRFVPVAFEMANALQIYRSRRDDGGRRHH